LTTETHYRKLENLFHSALVQKLYPGINISIKQAICTITYPVNTAHFHGGNALHGAVYFKLMDDAAYFAVSSIELSTFVVTAAFEIKLLKPITKGTISAIGKLDYAKGKVYTATAELFDEKGAILATGKGTFIKTSQTLDSLTGYAL